MIKCAIFDIDGVLLDSMGIWNDLGARYLRNRGIVPENGLNDILFSMSMEQGTEYLKEKYALPDTADDILLGIKEMLRVYYFDEVLPKPGAMEMLRSLRYMGIAISAATSSPREHIEAALKRNGLMQYIGRLYTTSEEHTSKHQPDIYLKAALHMGTEPGETIVAEDSLYALTTARNAGFITVGVYDPLGEKDQSGLKNTADHYITDLADLAAIIKGVNEG